MPQKLFFSKKTNLTYTLTMHAPLSQIKNKKIKPLLNGLLFE